MREKMPIGEIRRGEPIKVGVEEETRSEAETKRCPQCGANMVLHDTVHYCDVPQTVLYEWWCACGHTEPAEGRATEVDTLMAQWRRANPGRAETSS